MLPDCMWRTVSDTSTRAVSAVIDGPVNHSLIDAVPENAG